MKPMLAKGQSKIPEGDEWVFEPKWDGFRVLIWRDGDDLFLQSRDCKPLLRYFPELREPLLAQLPQQCVVDGELVIAGDGGLQFDSLQLRLHPAKSRIDKLAIELPAQVVLWDLLALGSEDLRQVQFGDRRQMLEAAFTPQAPIHLTPLTADREVAHDWFVRFEGAGLDGIVAKGIHDTYQPDKRIMRKIKHERTIDVVLCGFRWHKHGPGTLVGSLILGLYDDAGELKQLGVAASFTKDRRAELVGELEPLRSDTDQHPWRGWVDHTDRRAGAGSRWSAGRDLSWELVRIERVVEVKYNHLASGRFRHPVQFKRWRMDKSPEDCRFDQLEVTPPLELGELFASARATSE